MSTAERDDNQHRRAARARWDRIPDPAARAAETAPATAARVNAATVAEEFQAFRAELAALRAELDEVRAERLAA